MKKNDKTVAIILDGHRESPRMALGNNAVTSSDIWLVKVFNAASGATQMIKIRQATNTLKSFDIVAFPDHAPSDDFKTLPIVKIARHALTDFEGDEKAYLKSTIKNLKAEKRMIMDVFGANGVAGYARAYVKIGLANLTKKSPAGRDYKPYTPKKP